MIPLYSTSQVRQADKFAIEKLGMPGILLMENASREIFRIIEEYLPEPLSSKIGIVCGKGNNGGDGFAAARHFANAGYPVAVIYTAGENDLSDDARLNYTILKNIAQRNKNINLVKFKSAESLSVLKKCNVIVDAMLGSGASGELKSPYKEITAYIKKLKKFKVAVDIPTGLDCDKGYAEDKSKVDLTVTLGELKKGLFFGDGYELCGEIQKGEIGIDPRFFENFNVTEYLIEPEDAYNFLPLKKRGINKYSSGKVLVIAGSGKYPGAAVMTSKAVLKAGAGASILAFPISGKELIHKELTEVVVEQYNDNGTQVLSDKNIDELEKRILWADTIALGPGLGKEISTQQAVAKLLQKRNFKKLVIDADGLFLLRNGNYKKHNLKEVVLTPHLGEFSTITGIPPDKLKHDLIGYGKDFAVKTGCYLVLKGAPTMIFYGGEVFINTTGNPGMAKFGTGDVLTGILAGIMSQQQDILKSLISGVYLHSLAADLLMRKLTEYGYTAGDQIEYFPEAIKFIKDTFEFT